MPLAPSPVGGGVRGSSFWVHLSPLFPACSTRHDSLIASTRRPHALAAPSGPYHGFLEVPCFGESPAWLISPLRAFGDFWGLIFGPVGLRVACSICTRHSARLEPACIVPRLGPGRSIGAGSPHWPWGDKLQESLSLADGSHPFPEDLLEDIREILRAGRPATSSVALNIQDPDKGPTAGHGPTPGLAGHLATQEGAKRGGAGVPATPPTGRNNYSGHRRRGQDPHHLRWLGGRGQ